MSVNQVIPNEVLETIFLKLPTKDLLQCRCVSKFWKSFASSICRRRFVAAKMRWFFQNDSKTEAFYDTFQDTSDLPWSACDLRTAVAGRELNSEQMKRFTDKFGQNIRKLSLGGDKLNTIIPALMQMPNLEILISNIDPPAEDMGNACSGNRLELSKLKHLEIILRSVADIQLIEYICGNSRNLESILVQLGVHEVNRNVVTLAQDDLRRLIDTISRIPSIGFELWRNGTLDLYQAFTVPELKVKELEFEFPVVNVGDQYYRVLEQFLAGNSNCLEKLRITNFAGGRKSGPLRIPLLPKLKELDIYLCHVSSTTCHVYPFTSNQFPSLKKITVTLAGSGTQGIPISAQFDSVQELILHSSFNNANNSNPMNTDWSRIFPKLVTLDLKGVTVESYSYIYQNMSQLERLSLRVNILSAGVADGPGCIFVFEGDSNSILSQYPKDKNRGTVAQTQSLASLTNLKTLTLNFLGCKIPDSKVHLALLNLHPLDSLTFQNIEISSEVKEKLGEYHGNIEVQPNFGRF